MLNVSAALHIPVTKEMQKCIASFETLAQMAMRYIFSCSSPGFRFLLRFPSLTDSVELDLSHLSGNRNDEAETMSCWDFVSEPPFHHALHNRFFEYRSINFSIRRHPSHCIRLTPFSHGNTHSIYFLSLSNRLPGSNTFYWDGLLRLFPNSQIGNGGKYDHQTIGIKPYNIDQTDLCCFEIGSNIGSRKRVRKRLASRTAG